MIRMRREAMGVVYQVCEDRGLPPEAVLSRSRRMDLVSARRKIAHTLRLRGWSLAEIGYALDRTHHTILRLLRGRGGRGIGGLHNHSELMMQVGE